MATNNFTVDDFDYFLPEELIELIASMDGE